MLSLPSCPFNPWKGGHVEHAVCALGYNQCIYNPIRSDFAAHFLQKKKKVNSQIIDSRVRALEFFRKAPMVRTGTVYCTQDNSAILKFLKALPQKSEAVYLESLNIHE